MKKTFAFIWLLAGVLLTATSHAQAQDYSLSGRIASKADGAGLPGASMLVEGTNRGTSTNADALGLSITSKVGSYYTAATAPGVVRTYAELLSIKAELTH